MTAHLEENRRIHGRRRLAPMYTSVTAMLGDQPEAVLHGHAYDISQGGVRVELDEPIDAGRTVELHLGLPGEIASLQARADVVWVNDAVDDPGPRRMALKFTEFKTASDQQRLAMFISSRRAA